MEKQKRYDRVADKVCYLSITTIMFAAIAYCVAVV